MSKDKTKEVRVNERIRIPQVRVIGLEGEQIGVMPTKQALALAFEKGFDLVEISPNAKPPVCRIMDYGKWLYQQKRKVREAHKKTQRHVTTTKEVRLRPETDKHDLDIKVSHAREFLQKGHKVQFTVFFRGRQMLHKELGYEMLDRIVQSLQDLAKIERPSMMAARRMTLLIVPK